MPNTHIHRGDPTQLPPPGPDLRRAFIDHLVAFPVPPMNRSQMFYWLSMGSLFAGLGALARLLQGVVSGPVSWWVGLSWVPLVVAGVGFVAVADWWWLSGPRRADAYWRAKLAHTAAADQMWGWWESERPRLIVADQMSCWCMCDTFAEAQTDQRRIMRGHRRRARARTVIAGLCALAGSAVWWTGAANGGRGLGWVLAGQLLLVGGAVSFVQAGAAHWQATLSARRCEVLDPDLLQLRIGGICACGCHSFRLPRKAGGVPGVGGTLGGSEHPTSPPLNEEGGI